MSEPKVSIIILNWNQRKDTAECLESLNKLEYKNFSVVIVDNGSSDGSFEYLKGKFPHITLIRNEDNLGFAEGCNVGIRHALSTGTDYILLLNNDTFAEKDVLDVLVRTAEADKDIGVLGGVNCSYDEPSKLIEIGTNLNWWTGFTRKENLKAIESGSINTPQPIQGVTGSVLLIKKEVIDKIGLLDARFFIYYEDTDWCLRAGRAGYKVLYVPRAKVLHKTEAAFGKPQAPFLYLYTRNLPLFMLKNCPRIFLINFFIFYILKLAGRGLLFFIIGKWKECKAIIYGLTDFLRGNFGKGRLEEFIK